MIAEIEGPWNGKSHLHKISINRRRTRFNKIDA